jgi:hypothetical protein
MLALEIILDFPLCGECLPTVLYNVRGAWRSVNKPAFFGGAGSGETDQHLLCLQIN